MAPQYSRIQFSTSKQETNIDGHWFGNSFSLLVSILFYLIKNRYLKNGLTNYIDILHNAVLIPRGIKKLYIYFNGNLQNSAHTTKPLEHSLEISQNNCPITIHFYYF